MPGDVGDSKGTFHDRARQNGNIIVDGEVQSEESYRRSSAEVDENNSNTSSKSTESVSQSKIEGNVVEVTIESRGGTQDTMARYKNHQVHVEGGTPGETIRVRLEGKQGYLVGRRVSVRE